MKTDLRRMGKLKRQEGQDQPEMGGKLGESSFSEFKRGKAPEKIKIGMSVGWLSSPEVRR